MGLLLPQPFTLVAIAAVLIFASMAVEAWISRANERDLRAAGAVEPAGDVWRVMSLAYPASFAAMIIESALRGGPPAGMWVSGMAVWIAAKLLKGWAIASLGKRWSFRVLVVPGAPLVTAGPYRWLRHPNYVAVAGELVGAALMTAAPVAGIACGVGFAEILRRRIQVEERALGVERL